MGACSRSRYLPDSFGNLEKLQHLELIHCTKMQLLPASFGQLQQL
jgi:hypothetical protein